MGSCTLSSQRRKYSGLLKHVLVSLWGFSSPFLMYMDSFIQLSYHFTSDLGLEAKDTGMEKTRPCPHELTAHVLRLFSALRACIPGCVEF